MSFRKQWLDSSRRLPALFLAIGVLAVHFDWSSALLMVAIFAVAVSLGLSFSRTLRRPQ